MSDRPSGSREEWAPFDPALGWDLRSESVIDDDERDAAADGLAPPGPIAADGPLADGPDPAGPSDLRIDLPRVFDALMDPPDEPLQDLEYSLHAHPSDPPRRPLGPSASAPPRAARPPRRFPYPGEELADFRVVRELGRGAFARVYLAEQLSLASRQVALKASTQPVGEESQLLARLQHAHIVPIHSVHEDRATGLHLICMPYLGGANLAQVLEAAAAEVRPASQATGGSLIQALDQVGGPPPSLPASRAPAAASKPPAGGRGGPGSGRDAPGRPPSGPSGSASRVRSALDRCWSRLAGWSLGGDPASASDPDPDRAQPARRFLRRAGPIQASAWIAARLAEGLEHAHSRGLVHRDLKPSNVLITADGTPMILDFNLSALAEPGDGGDRARVGGTLPYMAPEHLDAFHPRGSTPPRAVDERSDLYSLGLILFEMVAGRLPFRDPPDGPPIAEVLDQMILERRAGAPSARAANPEVPWGLDSILRKCLAPDPARRYRRAGDLAEDLRLFLDDRPLRHAPEPSLRERGAKFLRRNPQLRSSTSVGLVALVLLLAVGGLLLAVRGRWQADAARLALRDFEADFTRCQILLNSSGDLDGDSAAAGAELDRGLARAREALARYRVDRLGPDWVEGPMVAPLHPRDRMALIEQVSELLMLEARASVLAARRGPEAAYAAALRRALGRLDLAERFDPRPPSILFAERASYASALGLADRADRDRERAAATPPETARDFYLRGTAALAAGRPDLAEAHLDRALGLDPRRFWSWFALGLCHYDQGRYGSAAADFSACVLLNPGSARAHANRGLALAMDGRTAEARRAYDEAVRLDPDLIPARINRALACLELDDPARAAADLQFAIERSGRRDPALLAAWGEALARSGRRAEADRRFGDALKDRPGDPVILVARGFVRLSDAPAAARDDFERALAASPRSARAHLGMAHAVRKDDPHEALRHLDAALEAEPGLIDAVQLRALVRARLGLRSALADVDALRLVPTPHRLYNAAAALSLLHGAAPDPSLRVEALALLRRALDAGFSPSFAADDPDFAPLRDLPEFRALVAPR